MTTTYAPSPYALSDREATHQFAAFRRLVGLVAGHGASSLRRPAAASHRTFTGLIFGLADGLPHSIITPWGTHVFNQSGRSDHASEAAVLAALAEAGVTLNFVTEEHGVRYYGVSAVGNAVLGVAQMQRQAYAVDIPHRRRLWVELLERTSA